MVERGGVESYGQLHDTGGGGCGRNIKQRQRGAMAIAGGRRNRSDWLDRRSAFASYGGKGHPGRVAVAVHSLDTHVLSFSGVEAVVSRTNACTIVEGVRVPLISNGVEVVGGPPLA